MRFKFFCKTLILFVFFLYLVLDIQAQIITSVSPRIGTVGTILTINGSGFNTSPSNSAVYVGGVRATVTSATATRITIRVPSSPSSSNIQVVNLTTGLTAFTSEGFSYLFPGGTDQNLNRHFRRVDSSLVGPSLSSTVDYASNGQKMCSGDFDNDGKIDFVALGNTRDKNLYIYQNIGNPSINISATTFNRSLFSLSDDHHALGQEPVDLNNDGLLDLVIGGTNYITILENTSSGGTISFRAHRITTESTNNSRIKFFDMNGDGRIDILTAGGQPQVNVININGYSNQTFTTTFTKITVPSLLRNVSDFAVLPSQVIRPNIVVKMSNTTINANPSGFTIALLNIAHSPGSPGFGLINLNYYVDNDQAKSTYDDRLPDHGGLMTADFNNDGKQDLVFLRNGNDRFGDGGGERHVFVSLSQTTGGWSTPAQINFFQTGDLRPSSLKASDINGDGKLDIVVTGGFNTGIDAILADPKTDITSQFDFDYDRRFTSIYRRTPVTGAVIADFNQDGRLDIIHNSAGSSKLFYYSNKNIPAITLSRASINNFTQCGAENYPSQSILIGGTDLDTDISINLVNSFPDRFTYSLDDINYTWRGNLKLSPVNDTVRPTRVFIRMQTEGGNGTFANSLQVVSGIAIPQPLWLQGTKTGPLISLSSSAEYDTTTGTNRLNLPFKDASPTSGLVYSLSLISWGSTTPVPGFIPIVDQPITGASGNIVVQIPPQLPIGNYNLRMVVKEVATGCVTNTQNISLSVFSRFPSAPNITSTSPGNGQISIAFTPGQSRTLISNYQYSLDGGATWITRSPVSTISPLVITGLTNGTNYDILLRAVNSSGPGAAASTTGTPAAPPAAPTALFATPGDGQLTIAFTPGANNGSEIISYQYSLDNRTFITPNPLVTQSPLTITGLTNGVNYNVTLRAYNGQGGGGPASVSGIPVGVPVAPTALTAVSGNSQARISFRQTSNGGSPITNYEYSLDDGATWVAFSPANTNTVVTVTGLTNGTAYPIRLRARNAIGASEASQAISVTPGAPEPPINLQGIAASRQITVNFTPGSDNGNAITDYQYSLFAFGNWGPFISLDPKVTSSPITITGLNNGTAYSVRLRAVNAIGVSDNSVVIGPLTPADIPAAPTSLQATAGNAQVTIAFVAGANGGSAITNYEYTLDGGTTWIALTPSRSISPISITGLTNGTTYNIQLRARNAIGTSLPSTQVTATPAAAPAAPTQLAATPGDRQITLTFVPGQNNGSPITNYQYSLNGSANWISVNPAVTSGPIIITGLMNGTLYSIQLRAVNSIGAGLASATVTAIPGLPPQPPVNLVATPGNNQISISFIAGSNNGNNITNYQYSLDGGLTWISLNPARAISPSTITNLTNGQNYTIQLRAVNAVGPSASSLPVSSTPAPPPAAPSGLSYTTPNIFLLGNSISAIAPSVSGGVVSNYTISPALPAGLTMNANTGIISGSPTTTNSQSSYTITATNAGGSTTSIVSIAVVSVLPPNSLSYNTPNSFVLGTAITNLSPSVSGGAVSNYSSSPALPAGLTLNAITGEISGTPTAASTQRNYTITAKNAGGSTSFVVAITVTYPPAPSALSYRTPNSFLLGRPITNLVPTVVGKVDSYAISPALPAGLTLNASTGEISGTPTAISGQRSYTITARNTGGTTTATISLGVISVTAPSGLSYTTPNNFMVGTAISQLTPTVSGDAVTSYTISPLLPAGLILNTVTGIISGTPTTASATTNYTVTATNAAGSNSATISISVPNATPPSSLSYTTPQTYRIGVPISNLTPTVSGGSVVSYSISPALPAGLNLNAATGVISGTPSVSSPVTTYTITATNSGGSNTASIDLNVIAAVAPSGLSYTSPQVFTINGNPISNVTPTITGDPASFSISPSLPAGLTLNTNTGVISGTPTAVSSSGDYSITATNAGGNTSATINITVVNATPPSGLSYTTPNVFVLGSSIQNLTPTLSGGAATNYSISPALPAGVSFNATTGVISGTPTALSTSTNYTVTASNSGGNTTANISITVVSVLPPSSLSYATPQNYRVGVAISNLTPTISGGAVANYNISPSLPSGLTLNSLTGVISGTPTVTSAQKDYTVTATNASGSVTATVRITVLPQPITALSYLTPNSFLLRTPIADLSPTVSGGPVVGYSISPALPAGLSLNTSTGVISGTPTVTSAQTNYTVTASNASGSFTTVVGITVLQQALGIRYNTPNTFTIGAPTQSLTPTVIGALPQVLYKYARVIFSDVRNISSSNSIQVSEWRWLSGNSTISQVNTTVTNPGGSNPSGEAPSNIYDGNTSTKWLDFNIKINRTSTLEFEFPGQGFNITGYSWTTANDASERDPKSWKVFLSTNGTDWTEVDNVTGFDATSTRNTTAGTWTITAPNPNASSFAVSPTLPAGLILNTNTGVISGTPTAVTAQTNYTVTAVVAGTNVSTTVNIGAVNPTAPTGLTYITPNIYSVGDPINNLIPTVNGGMPFSYRITPVLPAGLSFNTITGVISGTPTVESADANYTITATNSAGSIDAIISIKVIYTEIASLFYSTPNNFTVGNLIVNLNPTTTGGTPSSYSINPALPSGLILNSSTGVISGTPTAVISETNYTITASNSAGSKTATVAIRVNQATAPASLSYATPNTFVVDGLAIASLSPTVTGGIVNGYNISPVLPAGLSFDRATGVISGTPTITSPQTNYTVTATNSGGVSTTTISIQIQAPAAPAGLNYPSPNTYSVGATINNLKPTVSGGNVTSYSVSPALPAGLSLNANTGEISGTPSVISNLTDYTITALNIGGSTTAVIRISVVAAQAPSSLSYISSSSFSVGTAIVNLVPTVTGVVTNYSVSPSLPAGLSLNSSTGVISGTPMAASLQTNYTITATNSGGKTTANLSITVANALSPSSLSYSVSNSFQVGIPINNLIPTVSGGPVVGYSINPALPAGLTLNTSTGIISGTPVASRAQQTYTVTAYNSGGSTSATFTIVISLPVAPVSLRYNTPNTFIVSGNAIADLTPSVSGVISNYSVSPALPNGLSLNTVTGIISGTPNAVVAQTNYTVTATNSGGSISTTVNITVNNSPAPSSVSYTTNNIFSTGFAINDLRPTVTGGRVSSYSITPSLPAGLILNANTGVISGTPLSALSQTSYTVTATNSGGSVTTSLSIAINLTQAPVALSYTTPNVFKVNGQNIQAIRPTSTGGAINTYSINAKLPKGLQFDVTSGEISGIPEEATAQADYIVSAVNSAGVATATLTITIINDDAPSGLSYPLNPPNVFILGTTIQNVVPTYSGGASTFTISPALPAGLSLDPVSGVISGTPMEISAQRNYTITATNSGGSTTFVIPITVNDLAPSGLTYPANPPNLFVIGAAVNTLIPSVSGGSGTYTVIPALPSGLTLDPVTGVISGIPAVEIPLTNFVITVSNASGSSSFTLGIKITKEAPNTLQYLTPNSFIKNGSNISPIVPTVSGGAVSIYTISPALPLGLSLNANTGEISGIPNLVISKTNYTVTATNSGGSTNANIEIEVVDIPPQNLVYPSPNGFILSSNPIDVLMPTASGGAITQYSISPSLPQGLTMSTTSGVISGIPIIESERKIYTVFGSNNAGAVSTSFTIEIQKDLPPLGFNYLSSLPLTFTVGARIVDLVPEISGGSVRFSVSPSLPAGLILDAVTGKISGTPISATNLTNYVISANGSGGILKFTLPIAVLDIPPSNLTYPPISSFLKGVPINNFTPSISGGAVKRFTISPDLPDGLIFDTLTGVISGVPILSFKDKIEFTITAINSGGETSTNIEFYVRDIPLDTLTYISPSIFIKGQKIKNLIPQVIGGVALTYSVSPSLPLGLTLDTITGVISGIPQEMKSLSNYTVTALNDEGAVSTIIEIKVNDAPPKNLKYTPAISFTTFGVNIIPMIPYSNGGVVEHYRIIPDLPDGLVLNSITGVISGSLNELLRGESTFTIIGVNESGEDSTTIKLIFNSPPSNITLSDLVVDENQSAGSKVGIFSVTDSDQGDSHSYTLVSGAGDEDNASFTIDKDTLRTNGVFDFEKKASYSVRVRVTDAGGLSFEKVFTITVIDLDEDSDGDGVMDSQENIDGTNRFDQCSLRLESQTITPSAQWLNGDCNGDGIRNGQQLVVTMYATKPQLLADGTMNLKYVTTIRNLRPESMDVNRVQNNLSNAFVGQTSFKVSGIKASGTLIAAGSYDGRNQTNKIASGSRIRGYSKDSVVVDVNVSPNGFAGIVNTTAVVEGTGTFSLPNIVSSTDTTLSANGQILPTGLPTKVEIPKVDYFIPDGFSPNRDGINDYFVVIRPYQATISLEVFNRWGNVVYKNGNYNNDWDGRALPQNGSGDVPVGTYFYIITSKESNGQVRQFKGSITLKR